MPFSLHHLYKSFKKKRLSPVDTKAILPVILEVAEPPQSVQKKATPLLIIEVVEPLHRSFNCSPLPVEIWDHIASMVMHKRDQNRLCQTSRTLQSICQPYLYRSIHITSTLEAGRIQSLAFTLHTPYIADLVTDINVRFDGCEYPKMNCRCNRLDELVGQVVVPLRNLQTLVYSCFLCTIGCYGRHEYLQKLETKKLTSLAISHCFCYDPKDSFPLQVISSLCMVNLVSLDWCSMDYDSLDPIHLALMKGKSYLPHLKEIACCGFTPFLPHFRKGSITVIRSYQDDSSLFNALLHCPPGPSHLYHEHLDRFLPDVVRNPTPYLKLRKMGVFFYNIYNDPSIVTTSLNRLSCLPCLFCIEISLSYLSYNSKNAGAHTASLVRELNRDLHKLQKVYTQIRSGDSHIQDSYQIWILTDSWKKSDVDQDTYWADGRRGSSEMSMEEIELVQLSNALIM